MPLFISLPDVLECKQVIENYYPTTCQGIFYWHWLLIIINKCTNKISKWNVFPNPLFSNIYCEFNCSIWPSRLHCVISIELIDVRWGCWIWNSFNGNNGARQGGMLSTKLFNVNLDKLNNIWNSSIIGDILEANAWFHEFVICQRPISTLIKQAEGILLKCTSILSHDYWTVCLSGNPIDLAWN